MSLHLIRSARIALHIHSLNLFFTYTTDAHLVNPALRATSNLRELSFNTLQTWHGFHADSNLSLETLVEGTTFQLHSLYLAPQWRLHYTGPRSFIREQSSSLRELEFTDGEGPWDDIQMPNLRIFGTQKNDEAVIEIVKHGQIERLSCDAYILESIDHTLPSIRALHVVGPEPALDPIVTQMLPNLTYLRVAVGGLEEVQSFLTPLQQLVRLDVYAGIYYWKHLPGRSDIEHIFICCPTLQDFIILLQMDCGNMCWFDRDSTDDGRRVAEDEDGPWKTWTIERDSREEETRGD